MTRRNFGVLALLIGSTLFVSGASAGGFVSFLEFFEDASDFDDIRSVLTTSNGSFVITGGWTGAVTTMSRNQDTGALTLVDSIDVSRVADAVLSPDNQHLYISTGYSDSVLVYSRDLASGALTYVAEYVDGSGDVDGLDLAVCIAISLDGKHVYAGGATDNGLAVFSRNAATGELTFVEVHFDGVDGVDGLDNPRGIVVSPDGAHVYVAASDDDSVAIFSRDSSTGALTWEGIVVDNVGGVSGLNGAYRVLMDPTGDYVYTGGNAVGVFERDAGTGLLTYVEHHTLAFSRAIAFDRVGRTLFVGSQTSDTLTVFGRNPATGALTLSSTVTNLVGDIEGMDGPYALALDPGNANVYVGCELDTLAVFQVGIFRDGFESGNTSGW